MIYMITKKHDTINLIKYNIIFIRLRLLSETIFSTANPHVFFKAILQRHSTQQSQVSARSFDNIDEVVRETPVCAPSQKAISNGLP